MYHYLQIIALHGMRGKKRSMLYMVLVLFLSMVFVVVNVSISGSLAKTQEQLRLDTYGDWDVALFSRGNLADSTKLTDERILDYGTAGIYGSLLDEGGTPVTCLGSPDDKLWELGHLSVESGRLPRKADEIAMEADVLSQLGYDYQLGQTVTLQLWDQREDAYGARAEGSVTTREYVLCGILREYTDLWVSEWGRLAGAVLSPAGAEALGRPVSYQYFVKVSDEDSMNAARLCRLWNGEEVCEALESAAASGRQQSAEYHLFNLVLILFTTIAAVVSIYSIQLKEQERSIRLFRVIGSTKKQLSVMIFYETVWMVLPAAAGGLGVGSLVTWGMLKLLMSQSFSTFYIAIPVGVILGIVILWFTAVFLTRFLIFHYVLRGRLMEENRKRKIKGRFKKWKRRLGLLGLSTALMMTGVLCLTESMLPLMNDRFWALEPSYLISAEPGCLISEEELAKLRSVPGVEGLQAWSQFHGALEFQGMEENAFCQLLARNERGTQPNLIEGEMPGEGEPFPKGIGSSVFAYSEDSWELIFQYPGTEIDRDQFAAGETVILCLPYNVEGGIAYGDKTYREFGIEPGDEITVTTYGIGEWKEDGGGTGRKNGETVQVEEYAYPKEVHQATAKVAGIITADFSRADQLSQGRRLLTGGGYYTVLSSPAFAEKLLAGEDGIQLDLGLWTNQEFGYRKADFYTGIEADFLSTDSLLAEYAAKRGMELKNFREEHMAYRQEAWQTLIQLWVSGACIFLILVLILLNLETILGISRRRSFALWQVIGMSRGRLRLRLLREAGLLSLGAWLLGHMGYFLFFAWKEMGHYRRLVEEFGDDLSNSYREIFWTNLTGTLSLVEPGTYLMVCGFCVVCVFFLFFCSQNRSLRGELREKMQ